MYWWGDGFYGVGDVTLRRFVLITCNFLPVNCLLLSGWKYQLARRVLSDDGSAGGVLILGGWKSALFFKSSLFERSEFGLL